LEPVKVVVTGPFGVGKTTFIRTISEITVLSTEQDISDESTFAEKNETTVAIDFGRITIDDDLVLYLFGTPGQERFEFMWEVASRGMLGYILLVDSTRPETFVEAARHLDFFQSANVDSAVPFIVAANKVEVEADRDSIAKALDLPDSAAILEVDALDRESVKAALLGFLEHVLDNLEDAAAVAV
jgi:small GTP-binding protein